MEKTSSQNKKRGSLRTGVLVRTLVPMLLMGVIFAISAISIYEKFLEKEMKRSLYGIASSVISAYDSMLDGSFYATGDTEPYRIYKGNTEITGNYTLVDTVAKNSEAEISLIFGNTRVLTTLKNSHGERFVNTGVNSAIVSEMSEKKEAICHDVDIEGVSYYACYLPLYNNDAFVGMVAAAKSVRDMNTERNEALVPIIVITLVCMILASVISVTYTTGILGDVHSMKKFLRGMMAGELSNELPAILIRRADEIGDMGKDLTDMQTAIRVLVERDPLTGLYNRRYGAARLRKLMQSKEKYGTACAVCICDIDFFKKVNDTYGHDAGDAVLKNVAAILTKGMTGKGFVARWGGEEFLLAFNKVGQTQAAAYLEEILDKIRASEVHYEGKTIRVTMCFGVADGGPYTEYGPLLNEADARLYYGKQNGRNQVVSTSSEVLKALAEEKKVKDLVHDEKQTAQEETNVAEKTPESVLPTEQEVEELIPSSVLAGRMAKEHDMDNSLFTQSELVEQIIQRIGDALLKEISEDDE